MLDVIAWWSCYPCYGEPKLLQHLQTQIWTGLAVKPKCGQVLGCERKSYSAVTGVQLVLVTFLILETGMRRQYWELQNVYFENNCWTRLDFIGHLELSEDAFSGRKLYMFMRYKQPAAVLKLATHHGCSGIKNVSNTAGRLEQGALPPALDKNTIIL